MAPIPPTDLPILALDHPKQRCVLNMNIAGADPKYAGGASGPIASYVVWLASENVDVITLQEVCSGQHSAVRDRLGPNWSDTFKNFGRVHGCGGAKFGLSIFTKGPHSDPWWKYLDGSPLGDLDKTDNETKNDGAWGLLKVRFKGIDVYSVHIRSFHRRKQIPQLAGLLIKPGSRKAIVAGDFNETPDHGRMTPFYDAWHECDAFNRPTLQTKGTKIDYIWTSWKPFQIFGGPVGTCKVDFTLDGVSAYYPTCARRFARHSPPGHSETAASRYEPAQRLLAHDQPDCQAVENLLASHHRRRTGGHMPSRKRNMTSPPLDGTEQSPAVRIFLGAASENDKALLALGRELKKSAQVYSWRTVFNEGVSTLETLRRAATAVDFAALLCGTEDRTTSRQETTASPRDNVVYEAGLFAGYLGPERTLVIAKPDTKLPSDYLGITNIPWTGVSRVVARVRKAMQRLGPTPTSRIAGTWWQFVTAGYESSSVISFVTIEIRPDSRVIVMHGISWNREGLQVATWNCPAAALDERTMTLHYSWEGPHTAEKELPEFFGTGEISFDHDPFGGRFSSTSLQSDRQAVRRNTRYLRARPTDTAIVYGTDATAKRRLIDERLRMRARLAGS